MEFIPPPVASKTQSNKARGKDKKATVRDSYSEGTIMVWVGTRFGSRTELVLPDRFYWSFEMF